MGSFAMGDEGSFLNSMNAMRGHISSSTSNNSKTPASWQTTVEGSTPDLTEIKPKPYVIYSQPKNSGEDSHSSNHSIEHSSAAANHSSYTLTSPFNAHGVVFRSLKPEQLMRHENQSLAGFKRPHAKVRV
jgi:hypothetical protein